MTVAVRPIWCDEPHVGGPFVLAPLTVPASLRQAISHALRSDPYILSLVSTRSFPNVVPQTAALPSLTYQIVSIVRGHHLTATDGVNRAVVRFGVCTKNLTDGETIAEAIRQRFDGFHGALSTSSGGSVVVIETLSLDEADGYTEPQDGTGRPFNFTLLDYLIRYREPRPTYGS